jgi:hypothetical protein
MFRFFGYHHVLHIDCCLECSFSILDSFKIVYIVLWAFTLKCDTPIYAFY